MSRKFQVVETWVASMAATSRGTCSRSTNAHSAALFTASPVTPASAKPATRANAGRARPAARDTRARGPRCAARPVDVVRRGGSAVRRDTAARVVRDGSDARGLGAIWDWSTTTIWASASRSAWRSCSTTGARASDPVRDITSTVNVDGDRAMPSPLSEPWLN